MSKKRVSVQPINTNRRHATITIGGTLKALEANLDFPPDPSEPIPAGSSVGDEMFGGKVAYIGNEFPEMGGMICHPEWDYDSSTRQWGCQGTTVGRGNGELGSGYENTETAVAATDCMDSDKAPRICWDTDTGGYTDWYLPSEDELDELYQNRGTLGGFATGNYWSSSEVSSRSARRQLFNFGTQSSFNKSVSNRFRAVRGF